MTRLLLGTAALFLTAGLALAQTTPKPPTSGELGQWVVWGAVAVGTVALSTTGQLLVALVTTYRATKAEASPGDCKASGPCTFDQGQAVRLEEVHHGLHYVDEEGTCRPILSGQRRKQQIDDSRKTRELLERLVAQGDRQTEILEELNRTWSEGRCPLGKDCG